jgi:hypothetical protein
MQFALLIYEDETVYGSDDGSDAGHHRQAYEHLASRTARRSAAAPRCAARRRRTTVRTQGRPAVLHDGPFAETKEQLGGCI